MLMTRAEINRLTKQRGKVPWLRFYKISSGGLRPADHRFGFRAVVYKNQETGLAERGAQVIATDLTLPNETVARIGPSAYAFQLDVTQEENWRSVSLTSRDVGDVDIVVNNAGYFPDRSIDELDLPIWRKTTATNLDPHFFSARPSPPNLTDNALCRVKEFPLRRPIWRCTFLETG
jgi:hypothetical protein